MALEKFRPKRHTDKTGDISEAAIVTRLLQSGYVVLSPYGKNHRYDLVIEDADEGFWRVQCKTGWLNKEQSVITFATASSYNHTATQKGWRHYRGQIDFFAVYVEQSGKVFLVPVECSRYYPGHAQVKSNKEQSGKKCTLGIGLRIISTRNA